MTAVEYYNLKVIDLMKQREQGKIDAINFRNELDQVFVRVKEMFKEQMIDANNRGWKVAREGIFEPAEQYYNETFKSER